MSDAFDWGAYLDTPSASDEGAPWFFCEEMTPIEGFVWCASLYAAMTALANRAGLSPDAMGELVIRSAEAMTHVPYDATPREEADYVVGAATALLAELF